MDTDVAAAGMGELAGAEHVADRSVLEASASGEDASDEIDGMVPEAVAQCQQRPQRICDDAESDATMERNASGENMAGSGC